MESVSGRSLHWTHWNTAILMCVGRKRNKRNKMKQDSWCIVHILMQVLTNIQYELFMVISTFGSGFCFSNVTVSLISLIFTWSRNNLKPHDTHTRSDELISLTIYGAHVQRAVRPRPCSWDNISFHFFTSWITSSSSITWSLPTFWGLCLTDAPHTRALGKEGFKTKELMFIQTTKKQHYCREFASENGKVHKHGQHLFYIWSFTTEWPSGYNVTLLLRLSNHMCVTVSDPSSPWRPGNAQ